MTTTTTKTRHVLQYKGFSEAWEDRDVLHTVEEAAVLLPIREKETPSLKFRTIKRTTVTTEEEISAPVAA